MTSLSPQKLPSTPALADTNWGDVDEHEILDYNSGTDTYRAKFDPSTDHSMMAIVSVVAAVSGTPPLELPPLYSAIDPNALEPLLKDTTGDSAPAQTEISATYNGHTITVHSKGVIAVQPPQPPERDRTSS